MACTNLNRPFMKSDGSITLDSRGWNVGILTHPASMNVSLLQDSSKNARISISIRVLLLKLEISL